MCDNNLPRVALDRRAGAGHSTTRCSEKKSAAIIFGNFSKNWSTFAEVITKTKVAHFFQEAKTVVH